MKVKPAKSKIMRRYFMSAYTLRYIFAAITLKALRATGTDIGGRAELLLCKVCSLLFWLVMCPLFVLSAVACAGVSREEAERINAEARESVARKRSPAVWLFE